MGAISSAPFGTRGENGGKYIQESTFKVTRQLHEIISARSKDVGGAHKLRKAWVTGMVLEVRLVFIRII